MGQPEITPVYSFAIIISAERKKYYNAPLISLVVNELNEFVLQETINNKLFNKILNKFNYGRPKIYSRVEVSDGITLVSYC